MESLARDTSLTRKRRVAADLRLRLRLVSVPIRDSRGPIYHSLLEKEKGQQSK
jgi:hypothetical protein